MGDAGEGRFEVRRLGERDKAALAAFLVAVEAEAEPPGPPPRDRGTREAVDVLDLSAASTHAVLAAEDPDGLVAYASCVRIPKLDPRRGFLFIDELHVLVRARRRGIARALLGAANALAREQGLAGVRLLVRPENDPARRLYRSARFAESETVLCERLAADD